MSDAVAGVAVFISEGNQSFQALHEHVCVKAEARRGYERERYCPPCFPYVDPVSVRFGPVDRAPSRSQEQPACLLLPTPSRALSARAGFPCATSLREWP